MPSYTYVSVDKVTPDNGTVFGGTAVTIAGFGFEFATGVTFGDAAATNVVIVSTTTITAVTPIHDTGAVDVTVTGVDTLTNGYTYALAQVLLPPIPHTQPVEDAKTDRVTTPWFLWLTTLKQRVETIPGALQIAAEQVVGVFSATQIPQLPSSRLTVTSSPRLLGRTSSGTGPSEEIQVASGLTLTGGLLSVSPQTSTVIGDFSPDASLTVSADHFILFPDVFTLGPTVTLTLDTGAVARIL